MTTNYHERNHWMGTAAEMAACAPLNPGAIWFQTNTLDTYWWNGAVWVYIGGSSGIPGGFADGSEAAPSIFFTADTDTGFYRHGANTIGATHNLVVADTLYFGVGADTNLYRSSGSLLKTDDDLWVVGNVGIGATPDAAYKLYLSHATRAAIGFDNLFASPTFAGSISNGDKLVFYKAAGTSYRIGVGAIAEIWYQSSGGHRFLCGATGAYNGYESLSLDGAGVCILGATTSMYTRLGERLELNTVGNYGGISLISFVGADGGKAPIIEFTKSRGATDGVFTIVASGDYLGYIIFRGSDGTNIHDSSNIRAVVDAAPADGKIPGRLEFHTTNSAGVDVEAIRIDSAQKLWFSNAGDCCLYRGGAWALTTTANFVVFGADIFIRKDSGALFFGEHDDMYITYTSANEMFANPNFTVGGHLRLYNGSWAQLLFGNDAGSYDTNLYRAGANQLKTDDAFGIGMTPTSKLSVKDATSTNIDILTTSGGYSRNSSIIFDGTFSAAWGGGDTNARFIAKIDAGGDTARAWDGLFFRILTNKTDAVSWLERMRIDAYTGYVGIGTTAPAYLLHVNTDSAGKPGVGGLWTVVSDKRIKKNIVLADLDRCYEIIKAIPLKRFTFKDTCYTKEQVKDRSALGWIAQDVEPIFPKAVGKANMTFSKKVVIKDCLDLNSGQIFAALYGAVQKLQSMVEEQQEQILNLNTK